MAVSEAYLPYAGKNSIMPYYEVPVDVFENRDELAVWARSAYEAALRTRRRKKP